MRVVVLVMVVVVMMVVVMVAMAVARTRLRHHGEHRQHAGDREELGEGHGSFFLLG
jgi:hypothetical protein